MLVIFTERLALATRPRLAILLRPCLHAVETCGEEYERGNAEIVFHPQRRRGASLKNSLQIPRERRRLNGKDRFKGDREDKPPWRHPLPRNLGATYGDGRVREPST